MNATQSNKRYRILVVDDNQNVRITVGSMLAKLGYTVGDASSGRYAVNLLAEERFDLVLLDCLMPELDGYQTARLIRQGESGRSIPLIAVTAYGVKSDREKCLAAGMDDYITKPFEMDELIKEVKVLLDE